MTTALLSLGIISSSVLVVTATSPIISVLYVVALFLFAAIYLVVIGLPFVGLVYLVVYVGAVAVLFLFVIIILNVPISSYIGNERSAPLVILLAFIFLLTSILFYDMNFITMNFIDFDQILNTINQAQTLAYELFTHQSFLLILIGIILLLSIVGPVALSINHDQKELKQLLGNGVNEFNY